MNAVSSISLGQDFKKIGYVALKGFFGIMHDWALSPKEQQVLLGDISEPTYFKYKKLPKVKLSKDLLERISLIFGIHKALMILYSSQERGIAWLRKNNKAFSDHTALEVMLNRGSLIDIYRVRKYLDAWRG